MLAMIALGRGPDASTIGSPVKRSTATARNGIGRSSKLTAPALRSVAALSSQEIQRVRTSPEARPIRSGPKATGRSLLVIVASRSINSLIWALLLVAIIGPGLMAGIVAIALRSIGFIGKLLYEAIEEIDEAQVESVAATGASRWQVMDYAVWPQIAPAFAGISVFRWDINIRESTILGLVGAGGIGLQLQSSLARLAWAEVTVIFIVILVTVAISEWISAKVRAAII
jgi:phosphonate ABC transporter permease subunit PhnE